MNRHHLVYLVSLSLMSFGCGSGSKLEGAEAASYLSGAVFIPDEGEELPEDVETDTSIEITAPSGDSSLPTPVKGGGNVAVQIPFNAPNGNVVAAGIRFGDSGPIRTVNVGGAMGQNSGTLAFDAMIPPDICDNLSQICHDIKCYEFAVTSVGKVSRANIASLAVTCGDCDEPSCQDLLPMCDVPGGSFDTGGLICAGAMGQSCPNGTSLDFCIDPGGSECFYTVGGTKVDCGNCDTADQSFLNDCAMRAAELCGS